ncbi:cytochrome P450 [Mycena vitilis]|nr:cytochrome P450 [Mycena vitilis]
MLLALASATTVILAYRFVRNLAAVDYEPGMRPLFSPLGLFGAVIPTCWLNPGLKWVWEWRESNFRYHQYDVVSMVPLIFGDAFFYTCSVDVVKQLLVNESKTRLIKPGWLTAPLLLWGQNVISANGEVWKRHRRIMAPAFTTETYSLIVKETVAVYREMLTSQGWETQDKVDVPDVSSLPHKLALIIIARCGFGFNMPYETPTPHGTMPFGQALDIVSGSAVARLVLPRWAYSLPIKQVRMMGEAWRTLASFMHSLIDTRRGELNEMTGEEGQAGDIFSRLVAAMDKDETAKLSLNQQEVLGNTFALLFAGRETTGCALVATLGFLAIHQDLQEAAYAEIMANIPSDRDPVLEDLSKLPHLLACFNESIRMYPGGAMLTREMTEDVPITVMRPIEKTMILKKGTLMVVEMIAVHHNPHVFPDPDEYRPSRWYGVPETEIPMFGHGPRACLGRKFSYTEAMCFLSMFLRDWKLDVPLKDGETRVEYEKRVMRKAGRIGMAFGCGAIALKMARRR